MATRDIAQEIINAVKSGKPDYVVTALVQERANKKAAMGSNDNTPSNETILSTAAALAAAGKNIITGAADKVKETTTDQSAADIYDSAENYDNYTLPLSYDYSSSSSGSSGATLSKVVGYGIVGLVLLVVADRLIGK